MIRGTSPYAFVVTPSDSADLSADAGNTTTNGQKLVFVLMTRTAGNVSLITSDGNQMDLASVPAFTVIGSPYPLLVRRVRSTGTTAQVVALRPMHIG